MFVRSISQAWAWNRILVSQLKILGKSRSRLTYPPPTHFFYKDPREILNPIVQLYKMDSYKKLGYPSIIDYLRRELGCSDDAAYRRWKAAKLLLHIPEMGEQIAAGNLNLTQSAQVQKAVEAIKKEENRSVSIEKQKKLLNLIANKNNFDTQKMIAEKLEIKPKLGDFVKPQADH